MDRDRTGSQPPANASDAESLRDRLDRSSRSLRGIHGTGGGLLLSAAIFLACGFFLNWTHERLVSGELVPLVVTLKWSLRGAGVLFLACAVAAFVGVRHAATAGAVVSIAAGLALGTVALWDWFDPTVFSGIPVVILAVVAAVTVSVGIADLAAHRR